MTLHAPAVTLKSKAITSYCEQCGREELGEHEKPTSPSKQRKKHLQTMLLDAAKMVPKIGLVRTSLRSQTRLQRSVFR
jgi:hypothetical protein